MKGALVAGPDPGHALPMVTLARLLAEAGHTVDFYSGLKWKHICDGKERQHFCELPGLAPRPTDNDNDSGQKLHERAGYMAELLAEKLRHRPVDYVVGDVITAGGGLAAELCALPWFELHPHPLYHPSRFLPPMGSGLEPGVTLRHRMRDSILRKLEKKSYEMGRQQRLRVRASIGLPPVAPEPQAHLVATFPRLEYERADWPPHAYLVGPLIDEPTTTMPDIPPGKDPLIVVSPSTAFTAVPGLLPAVVTGLQPENLGFPVRVFICAFDPATIELPPTSSLVTVGFGRQDVLLSQAAVAIGGGGHGFLAKTLRAGVPSVLTPGGGDQKEIAARAARFGAAKLVTTITPDSIAAAVADILSNPEYRIRAEKLGSIEGCHNPVTIIENNLDKPPAGNGTGNANQAHTGGSNAAH